MIALAASLFLFLALATGSVLVLAPARLGRKSSEERIRALRPDGEILFFGHLYDRMIKVLD